MRRALLFLPLLLTGCGSGGGSTTSGDAPDGGTCSLTAPAVPDARLHTDGTKLRDALGRVVILRGVNAGGRSKFAPFVPFDVPEGGFDAALASYLDRAQSWGIDVLRVPFSWDALEPTQGTDDAAYLARYDAILAGAWKRGMYTIIDFHQDIYAEVFCGDGFPAWTVPDPKPAPHHDCANWSSGYFSDPGVMAAFDAFWAADSSVQAAYVAMWDRMAARYKDTPGVIGFEPLNEPGWGTQNMEQFEATTLTSFYSSMIARLASAAPGVLIFFDATGPDATLGSTNLGRPTGDGIVFAPHYYQYGALSGAGGDPTRVRLDLTKWQNQAKTWSVPVLLGEFGTVNHVPDPVTYMTAHFDALDALGMHGTQWEYSVAAEEWNAEDLSPVRADGTENPMAEAIVRAYPRAVAGDDVTFTFDAKTRGFTLRYTPSAGITEVVTPARLYPEGYDVTIHGGCADAGTAGRLLLQADAGATAVEVTVTAR
ncbi:Endoglycoceramidase II [Minicystis rosea]|nr:Endoglycoceramidase II [Minicystis rosea]